MIHAVALWALLAGASAEPAAVPRDVSLVLEGCPMLPRDQVLRILTLELDAPVVEPQQAGERTVRVAVACADANVRIVVVDPPSGRELRRVTAFPAAQEDVVVRLVALAICELVLTTRVDPGPGKPRPEIVERAPPAEGPYLLALGQALGPFAGVGLGWGGGLRVGWGSDRRSVDRRWGGVGPAADVELAATGASVGRALGRVDVSLWSATLRASLRVRRGRAWLDVGGGGRLGLAHLQGQPQDPTATRGSTVAGTWAGPVAYAGVGARFGHVVVAAGFEGGRVLRTVSGLVDDGTPIAISGSWACGSLAVGWGQ